jgi:Skp family chaperone for outer membrane proteins
LDVNVYKSLAIGALIAVVGASPAFAQNAKSKDKAPAAPAAPAAAPAAPAAPGQYKIGVVNRKQIIESYTKVKAEYDKLKGEMDGLQKPIDDLSTKITSAKDAYSKNRETMTPEQRSAEELKIKDMISEHQRLLQTNQDKLDAKEGLLMKNVMGEIDGAVQQLAEKEGYHLIFEGSGHATAIYYSPTIDVTQKVVDILNSAK